MDHIQTYTCYCDHFFKGTEKEMEQYSPRGSNAVSLYHNRRFRNSVILYRGADNPMKRVHLIRPILACGDLSDAYEMLLSFYEEKTYDDLSIEDYFDSMKDSFELYNK